MKALLSVWDKSGIVDFARGLREAGADLVSTGGTARALAEAGLPVQEVSDLTGFPEMMDGRVKTLHPRVHAGILARRDRPQHLAQLGAHGIETIDLVCVNLYPFAETVRRPSVTLEEALENIDIGGPTMVRAGAKNFQFVTVVVDPQDYPWVLERVRVGGTSLEERRKLARKAFEHVSLYDATVARYLAQGSEEGMPATLVMGLSKRYDLRYGENPHQQAAFYVSPLDRGGVGEARQLHGRELSYNNLLDASAAWGSVCEFEECAVAVIKHTNPCGLAVHSDQAEAYRRAYAGDPVSAFGGIVACNRPVTEAAARAMGDVFYEIVLAPDFEPGALEVLSKKRNLRLLAMGEARRPTQPVLEVRQLNGGVLVQTGDVLEEVPTTWRTVTERAPTSDELRDLAFAWRVVKHVKSNAIVLAKDGALLGMGAGQPNRVTSVRLAVQAAGKRSAGSVMASDAFFPFPDGVEAAGEGGVTAVAQPGGSIRDQEVIAAANRLGMAMVFTGVRHFRH
ncbi:MAG: bifunctional phosphoribosylaminoimidazolecarboxamide formyltransferase/IMP cyclohydrolase [Chloroflexi bacterium]|nr:bifunctional phosphoribosylaminoimidazolecarboxamide formyltransferase/IMP cyclohydrolase [Chloroflexota bacterium]